MKKTPQTESQLEYALLERALYASDSGILITDASQHDNPIIWCNPGFERLTGYTFADIFGKNCRFLQGKDTDTETIRQVREAIATGRSIRVTVHNYKKDGSPFWNDLSVSPVRDNDGTLTHFIGIQNAVGQPPVDNDDQFESAQRYAESIVDTARGPLLILDSDLRVVTANLAFYRTFGVSHGETVGTHLYQLGSQQWDIPALRQLLEDVLPQSRTVQDFEVTHTFPHIGSRTMWLNARAVGEEDGLPARILLSLEDVTLRQDVLDSSVGFMRGALNALAAHVAVLDSTGVIVATNAAWNNFALANGAPVIDGCVGVGVNYLLLCEAATGECSEDALAMARGMRAVLNGEVESYEHEYPCHSPDERRWFIGRVTRFEYGGRRHLVTAHENITVRKLSEEAKEQHQRESEQMNVRLNRAMTETHHRIKNNLQVIAALTDIPAQDDLRAAETTLTRVRHHVQALAILHDIVTHQSKGSDSTWELIGTQEVIDRILPLLDSLLEGRPLRASTDDIMITLKQGEAISLLISELVSNAVKHGDGAIEITLRAEGNVARLEVRDNGKGFPADFDADVAARTGLELVISVARYDLYGTIEFGNRDDGDLGGGRVTVTFPIDVPA